MSASATVSDAARHSALSSSTSSSTDRFRFLRSLRDVLFGRRRRGRRTSHDVATVSRVKSSRSLDDELASADGDAGRLPTTAAAASASSSADSARHKLKPYDKMKSISTGDILDRSGSADWLLKCTSPDSMERRVLLGVSAVPADYHFVDLTRASDRDRQMHSVSSFEDLSDQDFFSIGWLQRPSVTASDITGDGRDGGPDVVDSLDVVACRQSLDVTVLKDRLAVKQKNRRQTTAVQHKINASHPTQNLVQDDRKVLATVVENSDSDVTHSATKKYRDEVVTCISDRKSRDGGDDDVTSVSVQSRSYSDGGGTESRASAVSVTSSPPAAAAAARGRGLPLITSSMLNDAIRRARPTAAAAASAGEPVKATPPRHDEGPDDGVQTAADDRSPAGRRRLQPRPVTMAPAGGTAISSSAGDGQPEWLPRRRTCDVDTDASK